MTLEKRPLQGGFSLLELIVAFVIMALALGMLYRATGSSAHAVGLAERHQKASLVADSILSMRDSVGPEGWQEAGESDGFVWRVVSSPYSTSTDGPNVPKLHEIAIEVRWQDGASAKTLAFQTLMPERTPVPESGVR
ncbi:MAG: prepilin-type N-terminal cleavage/methylation domain-containing protein [Gammaproteobacteria bacterium]|nr:prepilin-type N-terminal cleavage/methylation domain-containing protein [Gammaproteobacteria bacterium]